MCSNVYDASTVVRSKTAKQTQAVTMNPRTTTTYKLDIERLSEYKHTIANISRLRYDAIATRPVHRLQIRPIVHNYTGHPLLLPQVTSGPCNSVGMQPLTDRQTHRHTHTDTRDHNTFRVVYDSSEM